MFRRFSHSKKKHEENPELKELILVVKTNKGNVKDALDRLYELAGKYGEDEKRIAIFNAFKENEAFSSFIDIALKGNKGSNIKESALLLLAKLATVRVLKESIYSSLSREVS